MRANRRYVMRQPFTQKIWHKWLHRLNHGLGEDPKTMELREGIRFFRAVLAVKEPK